jgi:hypothetical protein
MQAAPADDSSRYGRVPIGRGVVPPWLGRGLNALASRMPFIDIGTARLWAPEQDFFALPATDEGAP